jgi:hypothetical protein
MKNVLQMNHLTKVRQLVRIQNYMLLEDSGFVKQGINEDTYRI